MSHSFLTNGRRGTLVLILGIVLLGSAAWAGNNAGDTGLRVVADLQAPGIEPELSGIYPHPTDPNLYLVVANKRPAYRAGQKPMLPEELRGKLLTVDGRTGEVVRRLDLNGGDYGDLAFGDGHLFISSLEPAEILKVDLDSGRIVSRIPLAGPAGGLEFDRDRGVLVAQLFVGHPHLAVVDPKTGATVDTLWSDESAMGLAKVNGDLLCTWASGFDAQAWSELRLLDPKTGKVQGRVALNGGVHTALAPLDRKVAGTDGFLSLVATDRGTGRVTVRKYAYETGKLSWRM